MGVTFGFNNPRNRVTIYRISGFSYDVISYKYLPIFRSADPDLKVRWGPLSNILYLSFHSFGVLWCFGGFCPKNKGEKGGPGHLPWICHCIWCGTPDGINISNTGLLKLTESL